MARNTGSRSGGVLVLKARGDVAFVGNGDREPVEAAVAAIDRAIERT